jgi:hypothetical protein
LLKLSENYCRNQVSTDYEEHIHTHKAAAKRLKASMEQYDRKHGKRPKTVYLSSVSQCILSNITHLMPLL